MLFPYVKPEYRTDAHENWVKENFRENVPLLTNEADMIAKILRNREDIPLPAKAAFVNDMIYCFMGRNQFFNHVRFRELALQTLPEGWPNRVDQFYKQEET